MSFCYASSGIAYAGFWRRASAEAIDNTIFGFVVFFVSLALGLFLSYAAISPALSFNVIQAMLFVVCMVYFALFESSRYQASPGKKLLGLLVTDLQGARLGFWQALERNLWKASYCFSIWLACHLVPREQLKSLGTINVLVLIAAALLIFGGVLVAAVQPFLIVFSARKQALHDRLSGCLIFQGQKNRGYAIFEKLWVWLLVAIFAGIILIFVAGAASSPGEPSVNPTSKIDYRPVGLREGKAIRLRADADNDEILRQLGGEISRFEGSARDPDPLSRVEELFERKW